MLRLLELRGDRTQSYIAQHTGLTQQAYRNYENGTREPKLEILVRLADYFGVTVDYLLNHEPTGMSTTKQKLIDEINTLSEDQLDFVLCIVRKGKELNKL